MTMKAVIEISEKARSAAEEQAAANGFATVGEYVEALLLDDPDDLDAIMNQSWFLKKIEEGLASEDAGELTKERIARLVQEGIALAKRDK